MYALSADLKDRLGESVYAEIYGDDATAAASTAETDLASAQAEIDGVLAAHYSVPVIAGAEALALLKNWTVTLAEELAYTRSAGSAYTDKVKERVAQVRKYLDMILDGRFRIAGALDATDGCGAFVMAESDPPNFDRDGMAGF